MNLQVRSIDVQKSKEDLKKCPKSVQDYVRSLEKVYEINQQTLHKAISKLKNSGRFQPISSPSDLVVEVDGDRVMWESITLLSDEKARVMIAYWQGDQGLDTVTGVDHHIRLLTPQGEVVLDNKLNHKSEEG